MKGKAIKWNLSIPSHARKYIKHFNKQNEKVRPGGITFVRMSSGREINLSSMSDQDAVMIANEFAGMAHQAQLNRKLN